MFLQHSNKVTGANDETRIRNPSVINRVLLSTVVLLDTGTPGTSREIYIEDADGETRTRNPSVIRRVLWPLIYIAQKLLLGRSGGVELSLSSWCIASLYITFLNCG